MEQNHVDQTIAEATTVPGVTEGKPQALETQEIQEGEQPKKEVPEFDKKFENMKARLKNEKRAAQYELQKVKAELEELRTKSATPPQKTDGPPKETDYQTYGEFLQAEIEYKVKQALAQNQPKPQEQKVSPEEQYWIDTRSEAVAEQAEALLATNPEYNEILQKNAAILDVMPAHVERAFLEADNAPLAFIALAQEGKLAGLLTMSPQRVAMEIAKAEVRGEALVKVKPVTNAPAPISSNKGSGAVGKSLDAMSGQELNAWRKS